MISDGLLGPLKGWVIDKIHIRETNGAPSKVCNSQEISVLRLDYTRVLSRLPGDYSAEMLW